MRWNQSSTRSSSQWLSAPRSNRIAVDDDLLSLITSEEAVKVSEQMSRVYLLLLGTIPADPDNRLPAAQEWLLQFEGGEKDGSHASAWQQLQAVMVGVDDEELRRVLGWMQERGIIDLCVDDHSLSITIRNVLPSP